jgi:RNA polymerase sigma-70 factor (ECF subfamily)
MPAMAPTPMPAPEEAELVELMGRYCDGEAAAFHTIYRRMAGRLLAYLVGLCDDRAAAEDLLQQTFLKIHQARGTYVRGAHPVPWFYTIAHRTCLDELRRRKRTLVRTTADGTVPDLRRAALSGESEEEAEARAKALSVHERAREALAALQRLPASQRQALLLTKIHGQSVNEAAAIAGTTPGAVKLRAHRAYVTLRERLVPKPEEVSS